MLSNYLLAVAALSASVSSSPAEPEYAPKLDKRLVSPYGPVLAECPSGSLIRAAKGVNPQEAAWASQRKIKASASLKSWLSGTGANFPALSAAQYPTMALVDGGGGFRGFLVSSGVRKAMDSAESQKTVMSGLYQAMTYETGLSGSSASLGGYASDNWPTVSSIQSSLWETSFANGVVMPNGGDPVTLAGITADVADKAVGFPVSIVDAWARLLSYLSVPGDQGGVADRWSDILNSAGYKSHNKPYPIITAIGVEDAEDGCGLPPKDATQYEFTPHEFGSWSSRINNFMQTKYIGTTMANGSPALLGLNCVNGFDNTGWVIATSTNTFNQECAVARDAAAPYVGLFNPDLYKQIRPLVRNLLGNGLQALYAQMPNPFFQLASAPSVTNAPNLMLVDGGETIQVPPIWPLLYRPDVSVLFVSDNSADSPGNYRARYGKGQRINLPGGQQLFHTYTQAKTNGVQNRLPTIPNQATFVKNNLNKKTVFFGCNEPANSPAVTIIYLPNRPITVDTNIPSDNTKFAVDLTRKVIQNGVQVAIDDGAAGFDTCVGCAVMKKAAAKAGKSLPAACAACFKKYCYN